MSSPEPHPPYLETRSYLSDLLEGAYKHELDHRDALWRTVPGVVAGFAFYVGLIGYIVVKAKPIDNQSIFVQLWHSMTLCSIIFGFCAFVCLARMLWYSTFEAVPYEDETLQFAKEHIRQQEYYRTNGVISEKQADDFALANIQMFMMGEQSAIISKNRKVNERRYLARGECVTMLVIAYAIVAIPALAAGIETRNNPTVSDTQIKSRAGE